MMNLFRKTIKNSFFQGSLFVTVANFAGGFLNYLFNIFAARALGPEGYGNITALFSYVTVFSIPVGIITQLIIIKIGDKKDTIGYTAGILDWFFERIRKFWIVGLLICIIIPFVPQLTNLSPLVGYTLVPLILLTYILALYDGVMQGLHMFFWVSLVGLISILIKFLSSIVVLTMWPNLAVIIIFMFISYIVKGLISQIKLTHVIKNTKHVIPSMNKTMTHLFKDTQIRLTAVSGAAILILSNIDVMYVKKMFSEEDAGIYGSWSLFAKIILYVLGPFITVSFIFFSSKKYSKYHRVALLGGITLLILCGFGAMMAYGLFGRELIDLLFGESFYSVIPFLEWASFFGTAYVLIMYLNNYFLAKGNNAAYILALTLPFYLIGLISYGKDLAQVILVNIWFSFGVLALYLLAFVRMRFIQIQK